MTTLTPEDVRRDPASQLAAGAGGGWLVIAGQELSDIWLSARGPAIVIGTSLLLSLLTYLAASNEELNIIDQRDTVNLVSQIAMALAVGVSLLFTADCLSGERERETLESMLVTPVPRRQIALGKYIAAASMWPVLLIVAVPYIWVLREGEGVFADAMLGALLVGTLLVTGFASLGLLVSIYSGSNRLSLAVAFFVFILLLAPTQLPLGGWFGDLIVQINPMTAGSTFLHRVIVKEHGWGEDVDLLIAPVVWAVVFTALAFIAARPAALAGELREMIRRGGPAAFIALLAFLISLAGVSGQAAGGLTVAVSQSQVSAVTGDSFTFTSEINNAGAEATQPLIANLAFVAIDGGTYVDPEDWSGERTRGVAPIAAGVTATQMWTVKTVLEGDVAAYVVVLPAPPALAPNSPLAVSPAIQMHVAEHRALNPGGVLPTVLVVPVVLLAAFGGMRVVRRFV